MKKIVLLVLFISLAFPAFVKSQNVAEIIKFEEFQERMDNSDKPLLIVNFWATWCAPCIKELPYFENALAANTANIDLLLVNLDFAEKIDKVNTFIDKKNLKGDVILLDEMDYNSWIDRVDPTWSGAIPATLVINTKTGEKTFVEGEMKEEELNKLITDFLL